MKIYLFNTLATGFVFTEILCRNIRVEGIVNVKAHNAGNINEYYNYKEFCEKNGIQYLEVESYSLKSENDKKLLMSKDIDILVTSAWQRLIPEWLINHCNVGAIGVHGSASGVTQGRGRSPQNWALLSGKKSFYISLFWITTGMDDGKIIDTMKFDYSMIDDIAISYEKESICIAEMLIDNINSGTIEAHYGVEQTGDAKYLPKRIASDGMIDWNRTGEEIYNFVRALTCPYPCAYTMNNDVVIKVVECKYLYINSILLQKYECGEVILNSESMAWVKCADGIIEIRKNANPDVSKIKQGDILQSCDFSQQLRQIIERHNDEVGTPLSDLILDLIK